jgi:hypothetical protein
MATIVINDLEENRELDKQAMAKVIGRLNSGAAHLQRYTRSDIWSPI